MASYDSGISQISVFREQDNNPRSLDYSPSSCPPIGFVTSPSPYHDDPLLNPLVTNSPKSPDGPGPPAPYSYPPPTPSVHSSDSNFCPASVGSRDIYPEHDLSSGLLTSPTQGVLSIVPITPPSPVQRHSSLVDSFKRITRCVRYLSLSSGDCDMGSDITPK